MNWILARCRIGCQIATLALMGLLGMGVIAGIGWWSAGMVDASDARVSAMRDARDKDDALQIALLQGRRAEKDFLLRHDDASLQRFDAAMKNARAILADLDAFTVREPVLSREVRTVAPEIERYATAFQTVVTVMRSAGLTPDTGLLGALRVSVHDVEEVLKEVKAPEVMVSMLTMRRHEKDFLARLDPADGVALRAQLPVFTKAVEAAGVAPEFKTRMLAQMERYQQDFAKLQDALLLVQKTTAQLSAEYAAMEPHILSLAAAFLDAAKAEEVHGDAVVRDAHRLMLMVLAGAILIGTVFSWFVGRGIARPIVLVTNVMQRLIQGDLAVEIPTESRRDEIGTMVNAMHAFKDSLVDAETLREAQQRQVEEADAQKKAALVRMAEQIERDASAAVTDIGAQTNAMTGTAEDMRALSDRTGVSAKAASDAAATALRNAETVASAAEQLEASIREITAQVGRSTMVVNGAVAAGDETRETITTLTERVGRIGAVADIIGDIASKTNLLALNATIEAARAGDAGKGFAVVASEVKQLASQTARSTEEITRHLAEVHTATQAAVAAVARIGATISEVNAISGSIAAAVEQQGAATAEIARNVTETASAVSEMTLRNAEVADEAERAGVFADQVLAGTQVLSAAIVDLRGVLVRTVRTSTAEVDRRLSDRHVTNIGCQVTLRGKAPAKAVLADVSTGGAYLTGLGATPLGEIGSVVISGTSGPLAFRVVGVHGDGIRVSFEIDDAARDAIRQFMESQTVRSAA